MRTRLVAFFLIITVIAIGQQKANYQLASRFSPKKLDKMIFSLAVDPHWLKLSNRFWYTYETSDGKQWYVVDPVKPEKKAMFNRDKMLKTCVTLQGDNFKIDGILNMDETWFMYSK